MSEIEKIVKETIQAYNKQWNYIKNQDMGSLLTEILIEQFKQQAMKIKNLPYQKENYLLNLIREEKEPKRGPFLRVQCQTSTTKNFESNQDFYGYDLDNQQAIYRNTEALYYQNELPQWLIATRYQGQKIRIIAHDEMKNIDLSLNEKGMQSHGLVFDVSHFFDEDDQPIFFVELQGGQELIESMIDCSLVNWYLVLEQGSHVDLKVSRVGERIKLTSPKLEKRVILCCVDIVNLEKFSPQYFYDAHFFYGDQGLKCDQIFLDDVELMKENIALFDHPLRLFSSCYFRQDEVLSKKKAMIHFSFEIETKCVDEGMELLQKQQYRAIMQQLPLEYPIYEVYADECILEYFNGTGWCSLKEAHSIQSLFANDKKQTVHLEFYCPTDLSICTIGSNQGYALRIRLVKSAHLYQLPAHIHVPYIRNINFSYSYPHGRRANQTFLKAKLKEIDITDTLGKEPHLLCPPLKTRNDALYMALKEINTDNPWSLYFQLANSSSYDESLTISYLADDQSYRPLRYHDDTLGFSRSGKITFYFPKSFKLHKEFEIDAYWLRFQWSSGLIPSVNVEEIIINTCILEYQEGSLNPIQKMVLKEQKAIKLRIMDEVFGYKYSPSEKQERKQIIHQYINQKSVLSTQGLKQMILDDHLEIADVRILNQQTPWNSETKNTNVVLLMREYDHHQQVMQMKEREIMNKLKEYQAYIEGDWVCCEPIFVYVEITAILVTLNSEGLELKEILTHALNTYLHPTLGNRQLGWKIGEKVDSNELFMILKNRYPDLQVRYWHVRVHGNYHGKNFACQLEDFKGYVGMVMCGGTHDLEIVREEEGLC